MNSDPGRCVVTVVSITEGFVEQKQRRVIGTCGQKRMQEVTGLLIPGSWYLKGTRVGSFPSCFWLLMQIHCTGPLVRSVHVDAVQRLNQSYI